MIKNRPFPVSEEVQLCWSFLIVLDSTVVSYNVYGIVGYLFILFKIMYSTIVLAPGTLGQL